MWVNRGDWRRALGVFEESPVGDALSPAVQKALLSLTPYSKLPSSDVLAPREGVEAMVARDDIIDKVVNRLPEGRARGTNLTNYEIIKATYHSGAKVGWRAFFKAFAAGALAATLAAAMRALRAVLLDKTGAGLQ